MLGWVTSRLGWIEAAYTSGQAFPSDFTLPNLEEDRPKAATANQNFQSWPYTREPESMPGIEPPAVLKKIWKMHHTPQAKPLRGQVSQKAQAEPLLPLLLAQRLDTQCLLELEVICSTLATNGKSAKLYLHPHCERIPARVKNTSVSKSCSLFPAPVLLGGLGSRLT